jgi:chloramphenicol-sensitive protein RarD
LLVPLAITSVLIAANWVVYILSVYLEKIAESSLGYYILPLASVLIGLVVFGERLRVLQWAALVLAVGGVAWMTVGAGTVPWIALTLAGSFGVYGAIRKTVPVDGLTGLSVETFLLTPVALAYLGWEAQHDGLAAVPGHWDLIGLVALSGIVTATPLFVFWTGGATAAALHDGVSAVYIAESAASDCLAHGNAGGGLDRLFSDLGGAGDLHGRLAGRISQSGACSRGTSRGAGSV